jgi:hypothetical protein
MKDIISVSPWGMGIFLHSSDCNGMIWDDSLGQQYEIGIQVTE